MISNGMAIKTELENNCNSKKEGVGIQKAVYWKRRKKTRGEIAGD